MAELVCHGEFVTDGEEQAARHLRDHLPATWVVICNKTFVHKEGRSWELDQVIVGERHIFVVDVKSIRGTVVGDEEHWILPSGDSMRSPVSKIEHNAGMVASRIRKALPPGEIGGPRIASGIIMLTEDTQLQIADPRRSSHIVKLRNAPAELIRRDSAKPFEPVGPNRQIVLRELRGLPDVSMPGRQIGAYSVTQKLDAAPHYISVMAVHESGDVRRLKLYRMSAGLSADEREQQRRLVWRDWEALRNLAGLSCVVPTELPFYWRNNEVFVVAYRLPPGRSLKQMAIGGVPLSLPQASATALAILDALDSVHQAGVLHRNLSPGCIHVDYGPSGKPQITFSDFDFARLESAATIAGQADSLYPASPYVAPECRRDLALASPASDIYAVGVVLFELFSGQHAARSVDKDGNLQLPASVLRWAEAPGCEGDRLRSAIAQMISRRASERAEGAAGVRQWCRTVLESAGGATG